MGIDDGAERLARMHALRDRARAEGEGRTLTPEQIDALAAPIQDGMDAAYAEIAASMTPEELAERRAMASTRHARRGGPGRRYRAEDHPGS